MARFYPVSPLFWPDDKTQGWNDSQRCLALYLLTCEHRNLEGLFRLPLGYVAEDLGWEHEKVREALGQLVSDGFAEYDSKARVMFLPNALKYYAPTGPKQIQGAINDLQQVPDTRLWEGFMKAAQEFAPALYEAVSNGGQP